MREGDDNQALKQFKEAVRIDPTNHLTHTALGDFYYIREKYDQAVEKYKRAIEMGGDGDDLTFKIGRAYYARKSFKQAIENFERISQDYRDNADRLYLLGESYRQDNSFANFTKAEGNFKRVLLLEPGNIKARMALGKLYYDNHLYRKAREHFVQVEDHPEADRNFQMEAKEYIINIDGRSQEAKMWHLLIPAMVILVIVPSYLILKKHKKDHPVKQEEEFFG